MTFTIATSIEPIVPSAVVVCPVFKDDLLGDAPDILGLGGDQLGELLQRGEIRSKLYETTFLPGSRSRPGLLLVGAGERETASGLYMLRVVAAASRYLTARKYARLAIVDRGNLEPFEFAHASTEGALRGAYNPGLKKTSADGARRLEEVVLVSTRSKHELQEGARVGQAVGEAALLARDLINLPPNDLTPTSFGERAAALCAENHIHCEVLDEKAMRGLGMGSFLGVAAGSAQPPVLIAMRYGSPDSDMELALVGKGITFDSGGLSLKTHEGMETMKGDMGGGAAVLAGMVAIARLGLKGISVAGYIGATENMPGGKAMRPGDVLTALNGETIEVLNTDAEGRLVLADVLTYAVQQGASHIVDFATLTGGAVVALGTACTLATGKPEGWVSSVTRAAERGLERVWAMPLFLEYRQAMDSDVADIKNTGGRAASALTAGAFLSDFAGDVSWAHLDIAGTSFESATSPYQSKGGTGVGVGTIVSLVRDLCAERSNRAQ